MFNYSVFFLF